MEIRQSLKDISDNEEKNLIVDTDSLDISNYVLFEDIEDFIKLLELTAPQLKK